MPRPPFSLTDDQARQLATGVATLVALHPRDKRSHRPFLRAFLQLVHEVTGAVYSPGIYHRLLGAYVPDRRPSTPTLVTETNAFAAGLASRPLESVASSVALGASAVQMQSLVYDAVQAALARHVSAPSASPSLEAEFYASRLKDAERRVASLQADAARLVAELAATREQLDERTDEMRHLKDQLHLQLTRSSEAASEIGELRRFAMQAIDAARGEARALSERCAAVEAQRRADAQLLEIYRQQAYRLGAAIPEQLLPEKRK